MGTSSNLEASGGLLRNMSMLNAEGWVNGDARVQRGILQAEGTYCHK